MFLSDSKHGFSSYEILRTSGSGLYRIQYSAHHDPQLAASVVSPQLVLDQIKMKIRHGVPPAKDQD